MTLWKQAALVGVLVALNGCVTTAATQAHRDVSSLVVLEENSIVVRESIVFSVGKADLNPLSLDLLDAVANIMNSTASIELLAIEGHTDSTGESEVNKPLSEARAAVVKRYLESKGVAGERLEAKGLGSGFPVDTNNSDEGRARNRRVEFKVRR